MAEILTHFGVQWFASHGSLLGAIRHQGLIPYDCASLLTRVARLARALGGGIKKFQVLDGWFATYRGFVYDVVLELMAICLHVLGFICVVFPALPPPSTCGGGGVPGRSISSWGDPLSGAVSGREGT